MSDAAPLAKDVIDAANANDGRHEGARAVHAKGVLLNGTFQATPEGSSLTTAGHLGGETIPVVARFSNAGGDPAGADYERVGRGLAVKFSLPDGSTTDMLGTSNPVFLARTPEDFLEFVRARAPLPETGEPDMAKVGAYLEAHPEALPAIQAVLGTPPPLSYATIPYSNPHSFRWTAPDGTQRWVRFRFDPVGGVETLDDDEAQKLGGDYLQTEILERVASGGASLDLVVIVGADDDPVDDPTAAWPADEREQIVAGRLDLTGEETGRERDGDVLVFDPTRVTDGIEPSDDPILHFRSHAYAESVLRRTGVARA